MARISMNNGLSVVDVATLSVAQMTRAIELTEESDPECREKAHAAWVATDGCQQSYLETFCDEHEAADLGVFTTDVGDPQ